MRGEGVDDGESTGTGGNSWIGFNRRRASAASVGSEVAIGWLRRRMWMVEWLRRSSEKRGVCWCAQFDEWSSPFIGLREGGGAVARSTMARLLRWSIELGEGVALFCGSWRVVWRRQLG